MSDWHGEKRCCVDKVEERLKGRDFLEKGISRTCAELSVK